MSEKTFYFKVAEARQWKSLLNALNALIDEAVFNVSGEGLKCRTMDPSHVAMVDMELPKTVFDDYTCGELVQICFNVSEMLKLLKRPGKESLELALDAKAARLKMILRRVGYTRTFTMNTLEQSKRIFQHPRLPLTLPSK